MNDDGVHLSDTRYIRLEHKSATYEVPVMTSIYWIQSNAAMCQILFEGR